MLKNIISKPFFFFFPVVVRVGSSESNSDCVWTHNMLYLTLAGRAKTRARWQGSVEQPVGQRARQNMKALQVPPTPAAAAANSIMANAPPLPGHSAGICGIHRLRFSTGNVIGAKSPSWATGGV